jgi:SAM-dependent methyltransferase
VEPHIPGFAQFECWRGKRVLEIGCGIGTDTMNFARAGASVTAVDLSQSSLDLAKRRAEVFGLSEKISFFQANAERLSESVPAQPYDLVYSFGVIHHTPFPERVIRQIREHYVHPGSVLKIMVYHSFSYKALTILLREGKGAFWKAAELVARHSEAQTGCPVTYTYTRRSAGRLLKGFSVEEARVEHIFSYRVEDYIRYRYVKAAPFNWIPPAMFRWMENRWGWHLCLTARPQEETRGR